MTPFSQQTKNDTHTKNSSKTMLSRNHRTQLTRSNKILLFIVCFAFFLGNLDLTVTNIAIAWIQKDFSTTLTSTQWVLTGYMLALAFFIIISKRLADLFGDRRLFLIGVTLFTVSSLFTGMAPTIWLLIAGRIIQGLSAACFLPAAVNIPLKTISKDLHPVVIGFVMSMAGIAMSVGPLVGGFLIHTLGWRGIFLLNVPVGISIIVMTYQYIPLIKSNHTAHKFSIAGSVLLMFALVSFMLSLNLFGNHTIEIRMPIRLLLFSILLGIGFYWFDRQTERPLIDFSLLKNRVFLGATLTRITLSFSYVSILFLCGLFFQHLLHYSAILAGLILLPFSIASGFSSPLIRKSPTLFTPFILLISFSFLLIGLLLLTRINLLHFHIPLLVFTLLTIGLGYGMSFPSVSTIGLSSVKKELHESASKLIYTLSLAGGSVGLVIMSIIIRNHSSHFLKHTLLSSKLHLSPTQLTHLHQTLIGAAPLSSLRKTLPANLVEPATQLVSNSLSATFTFAITPCLISIIVGIILFTLLTYKHHKKNKVILAHRLKEEKLLG